LYELNPVKFNLVTHPCNWRDCYYQGQTHVYYIDFK